MFSLCSSSFSCYPRERQGSSGHARTIVTCSVLKWHIISWLAYEAGTEPTKLWCALAHSFLPSWHLMMDLEKPHSLPPLPQFYWQGLSPVPQTRGERLSPCYRRGELETTELSTHNSMGPEGMHIRVLGVMANVAARAHFLISGRS